MDKRIIVVILFIVHVFIDVFLCQLAALPAGFPAGSRDATWDHYGHIYHDTIEYTCRGTSFDNNGNYSKYHNYHYNNYQWNDSRCEQAPNIARAGDLSYAVIPGAQVDLPSFTQHESFSYLLAGEGRPFQASDQLTPLWSGATGGFAPSTLDPGQREATVHQHEVETWMATPGWERPAPAVGLAAAPMRNMSDEQEQMLSCLRMVQEYAEEQRRIKEMKGRRRPPRPTDPLPDMPAELASMQDNLRARQSLGQDYLGDNSQCSFCLMDFGHGEVVTRLTCRHLFHSECLQDYAADGQRRTQEDCIQVQVHLPTGVHYLSSLIGASSTTRRSSSDIAMDARYYHAKTALANGAPALLVDIGAWTNVGGADRGREAAQAALNAGYEPKQTKLDCPLEIQGVGHGTQKGECKATVPVALMTEDGSATMFNYEVPLIDKSPKNGMGHQLPLIVGLRSLKDKRAVLELEDGKEMMTFPGPGGYTIQWSPGTVRIPMEQGLSGHLMVGCSQYDKLPKAKGGVETAAPTLHVVPGSAGDISSMIKGNKINLFISQCPILGFNVPQHKWHSHITQLLNWARLCKQNAVRYLILGFQGRKWDDPQIQSAIADGTLQCSYHRLCYMGIKVDPGEFFDVLTGVELDCAKDQHDTPTGEFNAEGPELHPHKRNQHHTDEPELHPHKRPVADAQPQLADGTDLAADDEQQARNTEAMSREPHQNLDWPERDRNPLTSDEHETSLDHHSTKEHGTQSKPTAQRGEVVDDKTEATLLSALWTAWIGIHGPMEQLVIDGEGGLNSDRAKATLKAEGIELITGAPGQHAHTAERSGQMLRLVIHMIVEQMVKEGITLPIKIVVSQAFFVMNAIYGKNGCTSYQCVYGRQPPMLPPIPGTGSTDSADGRQEQRVRQIAINSFVQASALSQTRRDLSGKSSSSGQGMYQPGDYVDYYRRSADKDTSGWYQDVRHTLHLIFLTQQVHFSDKEDHVRSKMLAIVLTHAEEAGSAPARRIGTATAGWAPARRTTALEVIPEGDSESDTTTETEALAVLHAHFETNSDGKYDDSLREELSKLSVDHPFRDDEFVSILIYVAGPSRKAVVTDQDVLTKDELKKCHKEVGHNSDGELHIMCGKHVDDLKVGGESHMVQKLRSSLEAVFGKLKFSLKTFTNVGIRHVQRDDGTVETDQTEHVNAIQTIPPEVYSGKRGDEKCTEQQMSMLCRQLQAFSDSVFRKEEDKGYGMRGANFLRVGVDPSGAQVCHLIDAQCRSHRRVTRNTFSSELFAGCDAVDDLTSHGLLPHLQYLREMLDMKQLGVLRWADTRDMNSDGHTKGCMPRDAIVLSMDGYFKYDHEYKDFVPKVPNQRDAQRQQQQPTASSATEPQHLSRPSPASFGTDRAGTEPQHFSESASCSSAASSGTDCDEEPQCQASTGTESQYSSCFSPASSGTDVDAEQEHPASNASRTQPGDTEAWRGIFEDTYRKYCPDKLKDIEFLLQKYHGHEKECHQCILVKYAGETRGTKPNHELKDNQCRICHGYGHWGHECPTRKASVGATAKARARPPWYQGR
ncbi:unnamed protein product [Prorocentrum cordatum]|uniref:RING-type domain-containing protein n=1 Tax=Prorocentrum cordatum TaxID=2364126 RepID=A0ABN9WF67_9DINO|nr:unnamed protein product [Polarella glacialis]